jgi:hypothetical protein
MTRVAKVTRSSGTENGVFDVLRQRNGDEHIGWIEVVLTRFVDDANKPVPGGLRIREQFVEFAWLE